LLSCALQLTSYGKLDAGEEPMKQEILARLVTDTFVPASAISLVIMQLTSYGKLDAGEEPMKQEILARGPIVCGIACPEEFVYKYHSAKRGGELLATGLGLCCRLPQA
jgi:hypothetical protein